VVDSRVLWYGVISIGTPRKSFNVLFDSECPARRSKDLHASSTHPILMKAGSVDICVPSSLCTSQNCGFKNKYDASKSSTGLSRDMHVTQQFEGGTAMSGGVYNDISESLYIS
jgi:Eukaryotic aspartyl protease